MENIQIDATVKSIRKDKTAAQLVYNDEETGEERAEWFSLADAVQNFVKVGKCKAKVTTEPDEETGNRVLLFFQYVASAGGARPQSGGFKKPFTSRPVSTNSSEESFESGNEAMNRMSALKNAAAIYTGTAREDDFKRLTVEILDFIEKGLWISKQKVGAPQNAKEPVQQGELSE